MFSYCVLNRKKSGLTTLPSLRVVFAGGRVLVTEFQAMALNGLFCADVLRPLDLVPLTDFIYKYHLAPTLVSEMTYTVSSGTLNSTIPYLAPTPRT